MNKALVVTNMETDPRILRPAIIKAGFRSQVVIPFLAAREVVGVMTLSSKTDRTYSIRELDLLTTIGMWAGTAIQNAQLQQQTKHIAVLEERERIGIVSYLLYIHDVQRVIQISFDIYPLFHIISYYLLYQI